MENYRRKWIKHFGPIPVDEKGRTYDIHHIDGNRNNNDISNLIAVSLEEHRKIHFDKGDWFAVLLIDVRLNRSIDESLRQKISENLNIVVKHLNSNIFYSWKIAIDKIQDICQKHKIEQNPKNITIKLEKLGIILIENKNDGKRRVGSKNPMYRKNDLMKEIQSRPEVKKKISEKLRVPKGPQKIIICPHCLKSGGISNMTRYHLNNCKSKTNL